MKKKPCHEYCQCETCEKARWIQPCSDGGHPTFWNTVKSSPQWGAWYQEQMRRFRTKTTKGVFDIDESQECGIISPEHFQEFIKFIKHEK